MEECYDLLEIKNVTKRFGDLVAVDDLSMEVKPGEIFALLGANGAGKTTTFRMITGLLVPDEGLITYNETAMGYDFSDYLGFLVEERALLTKLKVNELIIHFARIKGMKYNDIVTKLKYWLDYFNITEYYDKKIKELSKGNQQKIQFISSIINDPKVLILDEPFSGLDPMNIERMIEAIRILQKKGTMIIFSTHRIDHVELFCENLVVLHHGKTVLSGNIEKIKDDFRRKTIRIRAFVDVDKLSSIEGVVKVQENINEYILSVSDDGVVSKVFDYIKTCNNVTVFAVEKPSLEEIFIEKVGEVYDA